MHWMRKLCSCLRDRYYQIISFQVYYPHHHKYNLQSTISKLQTTNIHNKLTTLCLHHVSSPWRQQLYVYIYTKALKKKKGITNKLKNIIYLDIDNDFLSLRKLEIFLNNAKRNYIEVFPSIFYNYITIFFSSKLYP